jgi:hypothetical protein
MSESPDKVASRLRRLEDRYVMLAEPARRASFVGRDASSTDALSGRAAGAALAAWPRIKGIPVVGSLVYGLYRLVRRWTAR